MGQDGTGLGKEIEMDVRKAATGEMSKPWKQI
jgi:hypothetical protein